MNLCRRSCSILNNFDLSFEIVFLLVIAVWRMLYWKSRSKETTGRLGIVCRIISKYILKERNIMGRCDLDSSVSGPGPVAGFSEHGNESSGS